jgi:hypothetical protein
MTRDECAFLLKRIEALDSRMESDAETFMARRDAWLGVVGRVPLDGALAAVERFYRRESRFSIKPAELVSLVPETRPHRAREEGLVRVPLDFAARVEFFEAFWRDARLPVTENERRWCEQAGYPQHEVQP